MNMLDRVRAQVNHWATANHEHGAIMAATVLNTARPVEVSVYVVRAFVRLRELMTPPVPEKRPIGFIIPDEKPAAKSSGKK